MAGSRGKAFERELRKSFDRAPDALAYRIQDSVFIKNGHMVGSETPGDLWVFCKAGGLTAHLVEAKATSRKSFAFSMLSEGQVSSLSLFDAFSDGAMSWVAVNFYDEYSLRARNVCAILPFREVARLSADGAKSVPMDDAVSLGVVCPRSAGGVYDMSPWVDAVAKMGRNVIE